MTIKALTAAGQLRKLVAPKVDASQTIRVLQRLRKKRWAMPENVETSKQLSALRQIRAAIEHFHKGEFECAMTLAAAGEGQLPDSGGNFLWRILRRRAPAEDFNLFINWLKHATGPGNATISEFEVVLTISRAIHKFVSAYRKSCPEFEKFSSWAVKQGHMPTRLTQRQL